MTDMKKTISDNELALLTLPLPKDVYIYNMICNSLPLLKSQIVDYESQHYDIIQKNNEALMLRFINNTQQRYSQSPDILKLFS